MAQCITFIYSFSNNPKFQKRTWIWTCFKRLKLLLKYGNFNITRVYWYINKTPIWRDWGEGGLPKKGGLRQFANLRGDLEWSGGSGVFEGGWNLNGYLLALPIKVNAKLCCIQAVFLTEFLLEENLPEPWKQLYEYLFTCSLGLFWWKMFCSKVHSASKNKQNVCHSLKNNYKKLTLQNSAILEGSSETRL